MTLAESGNDFADGGAAEVDIAAANVVLNDGDAINFGTVDVTNLTLTAGGNVTQAAGGQAIVVNGTTTITATGNDVTLEEATNDFGPTGATGDATAPVHVTANAVSLTDVNAIQLGAVSADSLTVDAGGSITDTGTDAITVANATSLTAASGSDFFDIRLDGDDANASDRPHAFNTVAFTGEDFSIVDTDALTLNGTANLDSPPETADPTIAGGGTVLVNAGGPLTVGTLTTGGAVTLDAVGALTLNTVNAGGDVTASSTGPMDVIDLDSGGSVSLTALDTMTLSDVLADGDVDAISTGEMTITKVDSTNGAIRLETGESFLIVPPGDNIPLDAGTGITLRAPNGSFSGNSLPVGQTFRSNSGNIVFYFAEGFTVTADAISATPALTLDAPVSAISVENGFVGIGSSGFLSEAQSAGFNPFNTTAPLGATDLLRVTNAFAIHSGGGLTLRIQNTAVFAGAQDGEGTVVVGSTFLSGSFVGISMFGSFAGRTGPTAALPPGFLIDASGLGIPGFGAFTPDPAHTANGCVIGTVSSCTPLGTVTPVLDFEDGRLLSIKFVDPTEDEDDPFSNRGDEEEWE